MNHCYHYMIVMHEDYLKYQIILHYFLEALSLLINFLPERDTFVTNHHHVFLANHWEVLQANGSHQFYFEPQILFQNLLFLNNELVQNLYLMTIQHLSLYNNQLYFQSDGIKIFIKMAVTTLINNTSFHQYHNETIIISTGISSPSSYLLIFSVSFSFSVLTLLYFFPSVILFVFFETGIGFQGILDLSRSSSSRRSDC
ncbi:hypothetical protein AGLY_009487 [Aphis glycines]|uniref:Uncharacterized protein n=1 Tax=Aphis glycines TaxID=307491 RepID=A0A6G0THK2_APHGL|nr:hypothetical protein AGLY_009487 [Aphis glycines]